MPKVWEKDEGTDHEAPTPEDTVKIKNEETVPFAAPAVNPAFEADKDDLNGTMEKPGNPDEREKPEKQDNPVEPVAAVVPTNYGTIQAPVINVAPTSPRTRKISYTRPTAEENLAAENAIKRRHSDFGVISSPRPLNEDLALKAWNSGENLRKGGTDYDAIDAVKGKRNSMDAPRGRGPQWSPRLARKKMEGTKKNQKDERRRTLAELAVEAGYQGPDQVDSAPKEQSEEQSQNVAEDAAEDAVYSVKVVGEIYLDLSYELKNKDFRVHVHSANNLAAAEAKTESSDPYVKTYLLPDKKSKRKTKTKKSTLNPEFDETLLYTIGYDDLMTRVLWTSVWHSDRMGRNVFLGEVRIPIGPLIDSGYSLQSPQPKWYTLCQEPQESSAAVAPAEMILALKYVTADKVRKKGKKGSAAAGDKGELHVHLLEAKHLPGKDHDGMSDPYCRSILLPDKKGKTKFKTPVVKRNLNPSFDYKFVVEDQSVDDLKSKVLEITLWDHDLASSDEFLGGVRLGLGTSSHPWDDSNTDEAQIWQTILSRHNVWVQVVLLLRAEMKEGNKM